MGEVVRVGTLEVDVEHVQGDEDVAQEGDVEVELLLLLRLLVVGEALEIEDAHGVVEEGAVEVGAGMVVPADVELALVDDGVALEDDDYVEVLVVVMLLVVDEVVQRVVLQDVVEEEVVVVDVVLDVLGDEEDAVHAREVVVKCAASVG